MKSLLPGLLGLLLSAGQGHVHRHGEFSLLGLLAVLAIPIVILLAVAVFSRKHRDGSLAVVYLLVLSFVTLGPVFIFPKYGWLILLGELAAMGVLDSILNRKGRSNR